MASSGFWKSAWAGWKSFAHRLGNFQARLILTILYFVLIAPFCLLVRFFSDPLSLKKNTARGWVERADKPSAGDPREAEIKRAAEQF
jgi:hypothetical protein